MTRSNFNDLQLQASIAALQDSIQRWAMKHGLWYDCGFKTFIEHVDGEPGEPPVVTVFWFEGDLGRALDGDIDGLDLEFFDLLKARGFWHERIDNVTAHIYPEDDNPLLSDFSDYLHWQWVCSLIQPDISDIHEELYSHFAGCPDDLHRLGWRDFEILLFRIFQNQGFTAELGPGSGDGGVDLRLLQRDPIGDVLTLVQAKKYAPTRKINLDAVAALHGVATVDNAQRSLFVTTSSYLPSAKKFAERTSGSMQLATSADVRDWCRLASEGIVQDKSTLLAPNAVAKLLGSLTPRDTRIVCASVGYSMRLNQFALVLKESKHAALLMGIPSVTVSHDGYGQEGQEVPDLGEQCLKLPSSETVFRAKRSVRNGRVDYWDGSNLFTAWEGEPVFFSYID